MDAGFEYWQLISGPSTRGFINAKRTVQNLCRVLAGQANVPLVYVPLEAVGSKFYGECEKLLSEIFQAAEQLGPCLVFLGEIDALATSRGYVARVLSVWFSELDGGEHTASQERRLGSVAPASQV